MDQNVLIFLCESGDGNEKIFNIFDEIEMEKNEAVSFNIYTAVNSSKKDKTKFRFGIFLFRLMEGKRIQAFPLGTQEFERVDEIIDDERPFSITMFGTMRVENYLFTDSGEYMVVACEMEGDETMDSFIERESLAEKKIASSYKFDVRIV